MNINIRQATEEDIPQINEILNYIILNTVFNLNSSPRSYDEAKVWFYERVNKNYPVLVATKDDLVIGFACLYHFRFFSGYNSTAEISIYIDHNHQSQGVGAMLLTELEKCAIKLGLHCLMAVITEQNIPSQNLHTKRGFVKNGMIKEVAFKNGNYINVIFMSKLINPCLNIKNV